MYACGDEGDEKVHKEFHKDYTHGIQFKVLQFTFSSSNGSLLVFNECAGILIFISFTGVAQWKSC